MQFKSRFFWLLLILIGALVSSYASVQKEIAQLACCDLIMIDFKRDIATQVPFTNSKSLTKAITNVLDAPSNGKKK